MKVNGIVRRGYFHHYFAPKETRGLHLYNLAVGWSLLTVGVRWCPWSGGSNTRHPFPGSGWHIWISVPFMSLMLEWRR